MGTYLDEESDDIRRNESQRDSGRPDWQELGSAEVSRYTTENDIVCGDESVRLST